MTRPSHSMVCWQRPWRPTTPGAMSPSISIRGRDSPTGNRCSPRTCCSPGPCCATKAAPTIASIIPKSLRPKRRTRAPCGLISLAPPVGSGPYRVSAVKPGASVTVTRNPDYWGRDLPVNRGLWNFDEIRLDFYREANGQFEAFKRGLYDFRVESEPLRWHDGYDFPAARNGEVIRDTIKTGLPQPSEFLVFNTRRPVFS